MVKVRFIEVEGDPEEVIRVRHLFSEAPGSLSDASKRVEATQDTGTSNGALVTSDLVLRVLTRRELHANVKKVLKTLMKAGVKGLTSAEIAKAVGIDRGQLAGVLGAFGRRIANTSGWPVGADIIEQRRDDEGRRHYFLSATVSAALEKLSL